MTSYVAKGILRSGHTNSILSGSPARKLVVHRHSAQFRRRAKEQIIYTGEQVRLSALFNLQNTTNAPAVILLHGWLGCADSLYLVSLGDFLFNKGFHVIRLNFRDHGNTHHLNEELFHSCRIQEVIDACIAIQKQLPESLLSLVGFSLGGNFALRVNAFTSSDQLNLHHTVSYCPVIDPAQTLLSLETSFLIYRNYFMQRWKNSFYEKANVFPHLYTQKMFKNYDSLRNATEDLATRYAGFNSLESYLNGYSITGDRLKTLRTPAEIVLAKDDPIIPIQDQEKLARSEQLTVHNSNHGGHCGFLEPNLHSPWINQFTLKFCSQSNSAAL